MFISNVTIDDVRGGNPWWKVVAGGDTYATKSIWLATLAEQYKKNRAPVTIDYGSGWNWRELRNIIPVESLERVS